MKKLHDTIPIPPKASQVIGMLLRDIRTQAGLTQKQVGEKIGCFAHRICYLEKGRFIPNLDTIHKFAKACGRDFIIVLATEDDKKIINRLNN